MGLWEFLQGVPSKVGTATNKVGNIVGDAILGKQEPSNDYVNLQNVDTTTPEYKENMPLADIGISGNPRVGGLLNDIKAGAQENFNTKFTPSNWEEKLGADGRKKGLAYKFGEGLGSLAKFAESPVGRGLLMAGVVGASGGNGLQALGYGATTGVLNQQHRLEDKMYRDELEKRGIDTKGFRGYIKADTFKNLANATFKYKNLDQKTYTKLKQTYDEQLKAGTLTPEEYKNNIKLLNDQFITDQIKMANAGNVNISNDTRRVNIAENIAPHTIENLDARTGYYKNGGSKSGKTGKTGKAGSPIGATDTPPQKVKVKFEGRTYLVDQDKLDKYIAEGAEVI